MKVGVIAVSTFQGMSGFSNHQISKNRSLSYTTLTSFQGLCPSKSGKFMTSGESHALDYSF